MIKAIEIERFRGIEHLALDGLRMVNIIVGPSAAGKTTLLEAIRLALGATPQTAFGLSLRGAPMVFTQNSSREQFEELWIPLFFDHAIRRPVKLAIENADGERATIELFFDATKTVAQTAVGNAPGAMSANAPPIAPVALKRKSFSGVESTLYATVNSNGQIQLEQGEELGVAVDFLSPTWQTNPQLAAMMFSRLNIANKAAGVVDVLKKQFSEIEDLSVESPSYIAAVYASLHSVKRKIPLTLISSGINKFMTMLLAIEINTDGTMLVDEIENGIYYQTMPALWRALYASAKNARMQLFLTTHSWECLKSAAELIEEFPEDFSLIQMFQNDGRSTAMVAPGEHAVAAIEADVEVRA